jgi:hypothetical protein
MRTNVLGTITDIEKVLQTYTLEEILQLNDLEEIDVLYFLVEEKFLTLPLPNPL